LMHYSIGCSITASPFVSTGRHYAPQTRARQLQPKPQTADHFVNLLQRGNR
jgi:hypothetical protein